MAKRQDADAYSREEELLAGAASKPFSAGSQSGVFYDYNNPLVKQLQEMQSQGKSYNELQSYFKANSKPQATQIFNNMNEAYSANGYDPTKVVNSPTSTPASNNLRSAISNNQQTNGTTAQPTSTNPRIAALKAQLQQRIAQRQQQSQPLRNQSEVTKAQDLRAVLERNANMGYSNPIGRSNALQSQIAGENRLNDINLAEQNDISNIETEGIIQESQIEAEALRQAIADQQRKDDIAREDAKYNTDLALRLEDRNYNRNQNANETEYNRTQDALQQTQNDKMFEQTQLQQQAKLIAQANFNNIQGYINTLAPNDPIIPYLQAERQQKVLDAEAKFQQQGIITPDLAPILNKPVGTMTPQYEQNQKILQAKATDAQIKAETDLAWDKWTKNAPLTAREYQLINVDPGVKYVPPKNTTPVQKSSSGSSDPYTLDWKK
jgi:hypothetical protein